MQTQTQPTNAITWYNLSGTPVTLDGQKLDPLGTGATLTEILSDCISISGIKVNCVIDHQLSANGLPFPAYVHGVRYIVAPHMIAHCNRPDLFSALTDDNGNVIELRATKAATEVLTRQTERAEKRGNKNPPLSKKTQWPADGGNNTF